MHGQGPPTSFSKWTVVTPVLLQSESCPWVEQGCDPAFHLAIIYSLIKHMEACYVLAAVPRNKGMGTYLCSPSLQRPKTEQSVRSCVEGRNVGEGQRTGPRALKGFRMRKQQLWPALSGVPQTENVLGCNSCTPGGRVGPVFPGEWGHRRSVVRVEKEQLWGRRGWRGQRVGEVGPPWKDKVELHKTLAFSHQSGLCKKDQKPASQRCPLFPSCSSWLRVSEWFCCSNSSGWEASWVYSCCPVLAAGLRRHKERPTPRWQGCEDAHLPWNLVPQYYYPGQRGTSLPWRSSGDQKEHHWGWGAR